ncbi:MAG: hypothetical protein K8J31_10815 [Anaerolineae bacterium]|nr:hypothetical protein [Anaerolineae bacterium]
MCNLTALFCVIDKLTPEEKHQIITYLLGQQVDHLTPPHQRIFDLHAEVIKISGDFDDELPDSFWLGKR